MLSLTQLLLIVVAGGLLVAVLRYLIFWKVKEVSFYTPGKLLCLAHRGVPSKAPENTMQAFQAAIDAGVDGVELDVMATADGVLIVTHNYDLESETDGAGYFWEREYDEIADLNASHQWAGKYQVTRIPRVEEVLELLPDDMLVNLELKTRRWRVPGLEEGVVELVRRYRRVGRTIISSFNPYSLMKVRLLEPQVAIGYNWWDQDVPWYLRRPTLANLVHPDCLHPSADMVTPEVVDWAHRKGMKVNAWTVNNRPMIRHLKAMGVDGIFTDFPTLLDGLNDNGSS